MADLTWTSSQKDLLIEIFENLSKKINGDKAGNPLQFPDNVKIGKRRFLDLMSAVGIISPINGLTVSASFGSKEFFRWLLDEKFKMQDPSKVDEIRICFGVYDENFLREPYFDADNLGRITVFLIPFLSDKPAKYDAGAAGMQDIPSFDLGGLKP